MTHALTQLAHRAAGTVIHDLPANLVPADMNDAYAVQNEMLAAIDPVGVWKVSLYPETGEPNCSPLPASSIHASGARLPLRSLTGLAIEV